MEPEAPNRSPLDTTSRRARVLQWADLRSVPLRTVLVTIAIVVAVYLVGKLLYRLRDVVLLMLVGGFIALVLNPLVVALQRWRVPRRGLAVTIVTLWAALLFAGLAVAFGYPLVNSVTHFANDLPGYVNKAEHGKGWIGHLVRKYHIESWVNKNSPKLVSYAQNLSRPALNLGKGAISVIASLAAVFAFVLLLLLEAPKIRMSILAAMSPDRARRYSTIGGEVSRSISGFVVGDVLTSIVAGIVIFVTLAALGVPYALLFGLWVALVDFLPTIGGALAGIPTVLFALGHSLTVGIVTLVVFLLYTFFENHIPQPHRHEPHRQGESAARLHRRAHRRGHRQLGRWPLRRFRLRPARHPGCRVDSGRRPRDLARHRARECGPPGSAS